MTRLDVLFANKGKQQQAALLCFLTAGFPNLEMSARLLCALPRAGADIVELGIPFSDASADGEIIRSASYDALQQGINMQRIFELVKRFRQEHPRTPLVLMGYYNPIFFYGTETFLQKANEVGVDGVIVVDLPPEEAGEITQHLKGDELSLIHLITPTTDKKRLGRVAHSARGFLYYVSITGITGTSSPQLQRVKRHLSELETSLPVTIGFGIKEPSQARAFGSLAQGVVVGSALVNAIREDIVAGRDADAIEARLTRLIEDYARALADGD